MGMTEQQVNEEWKSGNVGRAITSAEMENWTKYGKPGGLAKSLSTPSTPSSASASSSAPSSAASTAPSSSAGEGGGRYTEDIFRAEWAQAGVGGEPTDADVDNWVKYGRQGQFLYENKGGFRNVEESEDGILVQRSDNVTRELGKDKEGNYTKILYTKYENFDPNIKHWVRGGGEGVALGGDRGEQFGDMSSRTKIKQSDDGSFYMYKERDSHGFLGAIDKAIGTNLEPFVEKYTPKELNAAISIASPTTARLIAGEDFNQRGVEKFADTTGLRAEEVNQYSSMVRQTAATIIGAIFAPVTGGASLLLAAAYKAGDYASQETAGMDVDWAHAGTDIATSVAVAVVPGGSLARTGVQFGGNVAMGEDWEDAAVSAGISTAADWAGQGDVMKTAYIEGGLSYAESGEIEDAIIPIASAGANVATGAQTSDHRSESPAEYIDRITGDLRTAQSPIDWGARRNRSPAAPGAGHQTSVPEIGVEIGEAEMHLYDEDIVTNLPRQPYIRD